MNAKTAGRKTEAALSKIESEREKEALRASKAGQKKNKKDYTFQLNIARKNIRKATRNGERCITVSNPLVVAQLQKEGYHSFHESGADNMGDSAAPCMVSWSHWVVEW